MIERIMKHIILRLILLLIPLLVSSGSTQHDLTSAIIEKSNIEFSIVNAGINVTGTIGNIVAEISLDPKHLNQSSVVAKVSAATIQTGIGIRDKHLRKSDYFHTEKYPEIVLRSKRISGGPHIFKGKFDLTIKDITREVAFSFKRTHKQDVTHYHGRFNINRLDFNLGEKSSVLDDIVTVTIDIDVK